MASGWTTTGGRYKIGSDGFVAVSRAIYSTEVSYGFYSEEAGGWVGHADTASGEAPTSEGVQTSIKNNAHVFPTSALTGNYQTVSSATLYAVDRAVSGNGFVAATVSTMYGGRYVAAGSSVTFSATAAQGSTFVGLAVNGVAASGATHTVPNVSSDLRAVASFAVTAYTLDRTSVPTNGSVAVSYKRGSGEWTPIDSFPFSQLQAGDILKFVSTPSAGYALAFVSVNGERFVQGEFEKTVEANPNTGSIPFYAEFAAVPSVENEVSHDGAKSSVAVTDSDGNAVTVSAGKFVCAIGETYTVTPTARTGYRIAALYDGDRKVSDGGPYAFTQWSASHGFVVTEESVSQLTVSLYVGNNTSATAASWNGCTCARTSSGTTHTFTPSAASGHSFVRLYIEDTDGTGHGRVINAAAGTSSYQATITFNARVVAIFKSNSESEPADADQDAGHAYVASGAFGVWEGGTGRMTATWRSRQYVLSRPASFAGARVYADGYGSTGPRLDVMQYSSPDAADANASSVSIVAASQNGFRLPIRRPEKYVQIQLTTDSQVLEAAVSTSMGGLWQQNV